MRAGSGPPEARFWTATSAADRGVKMRRLTDVEEAVASCEIVMELALLKPETVVPAGMPAPVIMRPTSAAMNVAGPVGEVVMVLLDAVVVALATDLLRLS